MIKENIVFLREGLAEFEYTGTLFPTSKWAAEALAAPLADRTSPKRILELGPGTGSVTVKILEEMIDGDELLICEINPRFMTALKKRLNSIPTYQRRKSQITFFEGPAQDLPEGRKFDLIICALPFLNFDLQTVEDIFTKLKSLSTNETTMTYYEYMGIRQVSKVISLPQRRRRMRQLDAFFKSLYPRYLLGRTPVWKNVLPINIYALQMNGEMEISGWRNDSANGNGHHNGSYAERRISGLR